MPKKILITPLDWGLGHATRSIPIVNEFLKRDCEVQIASSGSALILLKKEFPELKFHELVSYDAKYSSLLPFMLKILLQLPKFLLAINKEHRQIQKIIAQEKIDLIVSDNRYGCWSKKIKTVFVSHQLNIRASIFSPIVNFIQNKIIQKFSECWVPDYDGEEPLSGELTFNLKLKPKFIGHLSRLKWKESFASYQILIIISGPEPQRSIFEKIILNELKSYNEPCLLVRGLPNETNKQRIGNLEIADYLNDEEMNKAILQSELVISRSGYSTIMDLVALGKKAIFIPTKGQTEQEYLADLLMRKKIALSISQDKFNLQKALDTSKEYSGFERKIENVKLTETIERILNEVN